MSYSYQPFWIAFIILLNISLIGYLRVWRYNGFKKFFQSIFISRFTHQFYREEFALTNSVSIYLSLIFVMITSLFCVQVATHYNIGIGLLSFDLVSFLIICLSIIIIYAVKITFLKSIAFIIQKEEIINEYLFIIFLINQGIGLFLLPSVVCVAYGNDRLKQMAIISGIIVIVLFFIFRIGRGIALSVNQKSISIFYLFLYLCTLEVLPLLLGIKLFKTLL